MAVIHHRQRGFAQRAGCTVRLAFFSPEVTPVSLMGLWWALLAPRFRKGYRSASS